VWITEKEYNGLINSCKASFLLSGGLITTVFPLNELLTSTISGFISRRAGKGKVECNKLDPIKLGACEGICFILKKYYIILNYQKIKFN